MNFLRSKPFATTLLTLGALLAALFLLSLFTLPKLTLPGGRQIWLRGGELAWVIPTGTYATQFTGSRRIDFEISWNLSWKDWQPRRLRPARQGTWIQRFHWYPLAPPALATLALGAAARLLRRRNPPSLCPACSYDRSGLPPSATCPECGQTAA